MNTAKKRSETVYGPVIPWEMPVQLCIRDHLKAGGCALDVGANIGALSIAMSRIAGPTGRIYAFEPNPDVLTTLRDDLSANNIENVTVVADAAWRESGVQIPFYLDESYYASASSVKQLPGLSKKIEVQSISLDDYCDQNGISPDVIKLDVESAEIDVLIGAKKTIEQYYPIIILEYYPGEKPADDPLEFLDGFGYTFIDTQLYEQVSRSFYLNYATAVPANVNVLAIPQSRISSSPYRKIQFHEPQAIRPKVGERESRFIKLRKAGRYRVIFDLDGPEELVGAVKVLTDNEESLAYFEAPIPHLKTHSCANTIFEIEKPTRIRCKILLISDGDESKLILKNIDVARIVLGDEDGKQKLSPPLLSLKRFLNLRDLFKHKA